MSFGVLPYHLDLMAEVEAFLIADSFVDAVVVSPPPVELLDDHISWADFRLSSSSPSKHTVNNVTDLSTSQKRKIYRARKKNERGELRATISALESQLATLKRRANNRSNRLTQVTKTYGWRGVAFRQFNRRVEAETLNRELRVSLRQCRGVSNQLIKSWKQTLAPLKEQLPDGILHKNHGKKVMKFTEADMSVVARHAEEIAGTYSSADAIFAHWSSSGNQYRREQCWKFTAENKRECLEFLEGWAAPFSFDTSVAALQQAVVLQLSADCIPAILRVPSKQGDMYAVKHAYSLQSEDGSEIWHEGVFVGKIFMETDRAVLSWRDEIEGGSFRFFEQGYGIAKPTTNTTTELARTAFMLCTRYDSRNLEASSTKSQSYKDLEHFAEQVNRTSTQDTTEWLEAIENAAVLLQLRQTPGSSSTVAQSQS